MNIGLRIKEFRIERGLLQSELAKELNCSKQLISAWETSVCEPTLTMLTRLANFFGTSTDFLLGRIDEFGNEIK